MNDLAFALRPAVQGFSPLNTVLRGPPGTGKTTAVRRIFTQVQEVTQRVVPVLVSCQTEQAPNAIYSQIFLALFGHMPPWSGVANERILEKVARRLIERKAVLVVCLDDADALLPDGTLNRVLSAILRMYEAWPGTHTGVFLTVSDLSTDFSRSLNPATFSVLCPNEGAFPPYTAAEVRGILGERADLAAALAVGREGTAVSGKVYERVCAGGRISYTTFHERLRKLEHLRLVDLAVRQEKGRTRVIEVREGVEEVLAPVPAGSSGVPVNCPAGVCDNEKC